MAKKNRNNGHGSAPTTPTQPAEPVEPEVQEPVAEPAPTEATAPPQEPLPPINHAPAAASQLMAIEQLCDALKIDRIDTTGMTMADAAQQLSQLKLKLRKPHASTATGEPKAPKTPKAGQNYTAQTPPPVTDFTEDMIVERVNGHYAVITTPDKPGYFRAMHLPTQVCMPSPGGRPQITKKQERARELCLIWARNTANQVKAFTANAPDTVSPITPDPTEPTTPVVDELPPVMEPLAEPVVEATEVPDAVTI